MKLLAKVWRGEFSLRVLFWGFGVAGAGLAGLVLLTPMVVLVTPPNDAAVHAFRGFLAGVISYTLFVCVGITRAALKTIDARSILALVCVGLYLAMLAAMTAGMIMVDPFMVDPY